MKKKKYHISIKTRTVIARAAFIHFNKKLPNMNNETIVAENIKMAVIVVGSSIGPFTKSCVFFTCINNINYLILYNYVKMK